MKADYVILGGGIAGLCAARRLIELGIQPLVIEGGTYPSHKVCGEFISPSGVAILKKWDIHPLPIYQARWHSTSQTLNFTFPIPAGSLSHLTLDPQLVHQIFKQEVKILTNTKVQDLSPSFSINEPHSLQLSSGEKIFAKHLLIAAGRLPRFSGNPPCKRYMGFKAHFTGLELQSTLHMFSFSGSYLGVVPIENGNANVACLAKIKNVEKAFSPQHYMRNLLGAHPLLSRLLASGHNLFEEWMEAYVPEFGLRSPPDWPRTYWIGDAAHTIPPASGNGLSLALASGYLAAEFAARDDFVGFKKAWRKRSSPQILFGKRMHHLFLNPFLGNTAMKLGRWFPSLAQKLFLLTRDPGF
jgi:flavin-dependent dehydrogenase